MANIKINSTVFIRDGKLINRRAFNRIIKQRKITLTQAKQRVRELKNELNKLKELTANNNEKLEHGKLFNLSNKSRDSKINKGYFYIDKLGNKIPTVDLPTNQSTNQLIIHSHPHGSPLSINDVIYPKKKGSRIIAVDSDGSVYRSTKLASSKEIIDAYEAAKKKIKETGISKELVQNARLFNPQISESSLRENISQVATHKILQHLDRLKLIRYRIQLSPATKTKIARYKNIMDIKLKCNNKSLINFNK